MLSSSFRRASFKAVSLHDNLVDNATEASPFEAVAFDAAGLAAIGENAPVTGVDFSAPASRAEMVNRALSVLHSSSAHRLGISLLPVRALLAADRETGTKLRPLLY